MELTQEHQRAELLLGAYERARQQIATLAQREKHNALGRLSGGVAHEINNPLGAVAANLTALDRYARLLGKTLESGPVAEPVREALDDLPALIDETKVAVKRIQTVVSALASLRPSSTGALEPGDLRSCVESALELSHPQLPAGVKVSVVGEPLEPVALDASTLTQALVELLLNAYTAMPQGGTLTIELRSASGFASAFVRDTGVGIPANDLPHLFEPFFTTRPVGKERGLGLGLSRAFGIVTRHRGKLLVTSTLGVGTTAEVRLPLVASLRHPEVALAG
ncbi:MAG: ATP-binding protein [Myxococcales bacterium]